MAQFLADCQFKYGGLAKASGEKPGEYPSFIITYMPPPKPAVDPYHTYLSLAILAILPSEHGEDATWNLPHLDALWNATEETAQWARDHIPQNAHTA